MDEFLRDLTEFYIRCEERQEPAALDTLRLAPAECRVDQLVAVVWDVDQFWYRARVRAIVSLDRVEIQFIDYGTRAVCSKSQLYRLPECLKCLFKSQMYNVHIYYLCRVNIVHFGYSPFSFLG